MKSAFYWRTGVLCPAAFLLGVGSLAPILWESGIGSDVMKPIAAPIVGGMITSTIHVLILVPVFFVMMKERALKRGTLLSRQASATPPADAEPGYLATVHPHAD